MRGAGGRSRPPHAVRRDSGLRITRFPPHPEKEGQDGDRPAPGRAPCCATSPPGALRQPPSLLPLWGSRRWAPPCAREGQAEFLGQWSSQAPRAPLPTGDGAWGCRSWLTWPRKGTRDPNLPLETVKSFPPQRILDTFVEGEVDEILSFLQPNGSGPWPRRCGVAPSVSGEGCGSAQSCIHSVPLPHSSLKSGWPELHTP